MSTYEVTIPVAGHAIVVVEADNESDAKEKAYEIVSIDDVEDLEYLESFHRGNFSQCPSPWEVTVEEQK